jgi:acetyl-CoA acetyltransferase
MNNQKLAAACKGFIAISNGGNDRLEQTPKQWRGEVLRMIETQLDAYAARYGFTRRELAALALEWEASR